MSRKKLGLIVNPIAGMGGRVGLKGTDGTDILKRAVELGARPEAFSKSIEALKMLLPVKNNLEILTYSGDMGETQAKDLGFETTVIGRPHAESDQSATDSGYVPDSKSSSEADSQPGTEPLPFAVQTTFLDTENAASRMALTGVGLILFAGGDGTARNVYNAVKDKVPVLGIPAGVKIHSPVYATNPRNAGELAYKFVTGQVTSFREAEVMDIDEDAFREGRVSPKLYGFLLVPHEERLMQNLKSGSVESQAAAIDGIADKIIEEMEQGVLYIIGPGTTTRPIMEKLGLDFTLLGVDMVLDKRLAVADATEQDLLEALANCHKARIIVTIIGGQGYVFGRGNQQLSPEVIKKVGAENIRIVATRDKLDALDRRPLLVDTGDEALNETLSGYVRVLVSYDREVMYRLG